MIRPLHESTQNYFLVDESEVIEGVGWSETLYSHVCTVISVQDALCCQLEKRIHPHCSLSQFSVANK